MKKLMLGAAVSALMLSGAMAQTKAPDSPPASAPPAATQDQPAAKPDMATPAKPDTAAPAAKPDMPAPAAQANQGTDKPAFVMSQKPDQWLASKFKGTDVLGADNKKIGDVSDILFDKTGKVEAFVVSVGGFLGMGAKDVALAPSSFDVVPGEKGGADQLKISMTQEELKQAEKFTAYEPPRPATTTGAGAPMGGARPPSGAPSGR